MTDNLSERSLSHWPRLLRPIVWSLRHVPYVLLVWRSARGVSSILPELLWLTPWVLQRIKISLTPPSRYRKLRVELESVPVPSASECLITLLLPTRKLGNPDNRMETLLSSFEELTEHPERCEILLKVDADDDLSFYYGLKKRFSALNLRFFVTPRGRGYADVHRHFAYLADRASPTSKACVFLNDDLKITRRGWDQDAYELIQGGTVFFAGAISPDTIGTLNLVGNHPRPHYSYVSDSFPIFSMKLVESLRSASEGLEGWTSLGNLYVLDAFLTSLILLFRQKHGIDIYHQIEKWGTIQPNRIGRLKNFRRTTVGSVADELDKFLEPSSVETRTQVVERMYQGGLFNSAAEVNPQA